MTVKTSVIKTVRNGNAVKRWHTRRMLTTDTVGEHTANVIIILLMLETSPSKSLIYAALLHDTAEQWTGDIPATAKWSSPELKFACDNLERKMLDDNYLALPHLTEHEQLALKWADMLDLLYRCIDELELGNTTMREVFDRGVTYLRGLGDHAVGLALLEDLIKERNDV
jgi:hypothetical protein